jgi:hypothetical protein
MPGSTYTPFFQKDRFGEFSRFSRILPPIISFLFFTPSLHRAFFLLPRFREAPWQSPAGDPAWYACPVKTIRTLELARTGEWGRDGSPVTRKDLAEAVETFAGRPPLTVGHIPKEQKEGPRYGQVLSVSLADNGNTLLGQVEFGDAANGAYLEGAFDRWSISIPRRGRDGKRYLHHLALLGGTPPKIPGLRELDVVSYEYADDDTIEAYSFESAIKEQEEARVTEQEAKELKEKAERLEAENKKLLEEKAEREKAEAAAKAGAKAAEKEAGDSKTTAAGETGGGEKGGEDFSDRLGRMEEELRKSRVEALMAKVGGKVPEGLHGKVKGLARALAGDDGGHEFSDGGKPASAKAIDLLAGILSQWPVPVKTGGGGFDYSDADGGGKGADWGKVARGM